MPLVAPTFKLRLHHGLLTLLLATACASSGVHPDDDLLRQAYQARDQGELLQAQEIAADLAERDRRRDEALELLAALARTHAREQLAAGEYFAAYQSFLTAADAGLVRSRRARDLKGALEAASHFHLDPSDRLELILRTIQDDPLNPDLHRQAAGLAEETHQDDLAAYHYLWLFTADPDDLRSGLRLGILYNALGQHGDAASILHRVHRREPDNIQAAFNLITALERLQNFQEAEALLLKLIENFPDQPAVFHRFAAFEDSRGNYEEAARLRRRAQELMPAVDEREMRPLR